MFNDLHFKDFKVSLILVDAELKLRLFQFKNSDILCFTKLRYRKKSFNSFKST